MRYSQVDPSRRRERIDVSIPPSSPSSKPPRRNAGEFLKAHLGTLTLKDLLYFGGLALTAATWAQSRASREDVETARRSCVEASASAIASAFAPLPQLPQRLKAIEKKLARNESRWDRLDVWHARAFSTPFKTPAPKFGPTAESRGEVRYETEGDDE